MRSIWKGALSFGLVTIPVKVYGATQTNDVSFHQVHDADGGRIRYRRVCELDGEEVPYEHIAKGYELPTGETVILTDDDFDALPIRTSRAVDVLEFVPAEQIDPIYFNRSYYLEPDGHGTKPYVLLRDALEESGRVAVVKVALRNRESLATVRVREGVLVLETMLWPDEIRDARFGFLDEDVDVRQQELAMAMSLIDSMTGDFDPAAFSDEYREALESVIEAKIEGRELVEAVEPTRTGEVVDLMAALRASVDNARTGGSGAAARSAGSAKATNPAAKKKKAPKTAPKSAAKTARKAAQKSLGKTAANAPAKKAKKAASKRSASSENGRTRAKKTA